MKNLRNFCFENNISIGKVYVRLNARVWGNTGFNLSFIDNGFKQICGGSRDAKDLFVYGFEWKATKEGHNYWSDVSKKWVEYCNKKRINYLTPIKSLKK